jgi:RNA polymerase sigma-70 factor (ECF subfamily)
MSRLSLIPAPPVASSREEEGTDLELIQGVAAGERAALEALYRRYHRRLDRFLARMTRRADVVEEVINETFWIVWQKADQFRGDSRVSTWIVGIAYRCALKCLRQHGENPVDADEHARDVHSLFDPGAARELNDWISKGLSYLTSVQRTTLELAYGAGHSLEEIAAIMECQVSTVKARMFHARVKLRNLLPALAGHGDMHASDAEEIE